MRFPTEEQGHEATQRGIDDAIAGKGRDGSPWSVRADDCVTVCLGICYQRGWSYGIQMELQRRFGEPPQAAEHVRNPDIAASINL